MLATARLASLGTDLAIPDVSLIAAVVVAALILLAAYLVVSSFAGTKR